MKKVAVYLAEGFEEIEAISIIDVLRRAEIETLAVSVTGNLEITGSHNIKLLADVLFEDVNHAEVAMIILPGGMPGSRNLQNHKGLQNQITDFYKNGKLLGAICAAPLVFGKLGILNGKNATCYPGFEAELIGAKVTGNIVEQSSGVITGKGAGVAIQFALKIVEMLKGKKIADDLSNKMMLP